MKQTIRTSLHRAVRRLLPFACALSISGQSSFADPGIIMGSSICDNQADSFDHQWITANVANTHLYFLSGTDAQNGAINRVGAAPAFNGADDVYIAVHGDVNQVDAFPATQFALLFLNNHAAVPNSVTFYVCQSGTPGGVGNISSMARVARAYPGQAQNSTLIQAVNAPAPNSCPALAVDAANQPFQPIQNIADAVYRTNINTTQGHNALLNALLHDWDNAATPYPNTQQSFHDYCDAQLQNDPTGQWVPGFIQNVVATFGADYLALINTNYGGNPLVTCGAGNGAQCN